jgi:signal transduction histidine kinase
MTPFIKYNILILILIVSHSYTALANNQQLYYLIDPKHQYTEGDIIEQFKLDKSTFKKTNGAVNLRLVTDKVWIVADSQLVVHNDIVVIKNSYLDEITVHLYDGHNFLSPMVAGDVHKFNQRSYNYIYPNFEYSSTAQILCLEVKSRGPMKIPVDFYTHQGLWENIQDNISFHFFYFGILFFTILLSLGIYSWFRSSIFLWYGLSVLGIGLITAFNYGYMFKIFWPNNPSFNRYAIILISCSILNLFFVEKLLNLKVNSKALFYSFRVFYVVFFIINIFCFFEQIVWRYEALMLGLCFAPIFPVLAGFLTYKKIRAPLGILYMIGVCTFFVAIGIYVLLLSGLLPVNVFTNNAIQIGSILEILFLNIALIFKMKLFQKDQKMFLINEKKALEQTIGSRTLELTLKNKLIQQKNSLLQNQHLILENTVKERTLELLQTNKALNDRNFRLEQFANVTAHNLRGPIATLLGLANIFNKKKLDDPLNEKIIENVYESATKVDTILRDLTTLLDNHQNTQSLIEKVEFESIFANVMSMLKTEFEKSDGKITIDFSDAPVGYIVPVYIKNVFFNLISNGLKYVHSGSNPQLEIRSYKVEDCIYIEFKDKGIGIDLDKYGDKLFKPYKRFHMAYPGKGLGLYTCKTQIEALGGKVLIQSKENTGTIFTVVLPDQSNLKDFNKKNAKDYALK